MIRVVEEGCEIANLKDEEEICVIYDRRGLEFDHIDINLFQQCRTLYRVLTVREHVTKIFYI